MEESANAQRPITAPLLTCCGAACKGGALSGPVVPMGGGAGEEARTPLPVQLVCCRNPHVPSETPMFHRKRRDQPGSALCPCLPTVPNSCHLALNVFAFQVPHRLIDARLRIMQRSQDSGSQGPRLKYITCYSSVGRRAARAPAHGRRCTAAPLLQRSRLKGPASDGVAASCATTSWGLGGKRMAYSGVRT